MSLAVASSLWTPLLVSPGREIPAGYPKVSGRKRALLVGVSYMGTARELKGTINDVTEMRRLLVDKFGFPSGCILELTEKESDPSRVPTRENLLLAMRWLTEGCASGDSLVFQFSGHGVQQLDLTDDEVDGYDEALCPADFEQRGVILDDEINEAIVRPLGRGVKLHAIIGTCHCGTILDLPYLCRISSITAVCLFCIDYARSEILLINYGYIFPLDPSMQGFSGSASIGAMMDSFINAVEAEPGTTYGRLLSAMRARIRDGQGSRRLPGKEPQLCSSEMFYIYRKPFLL
ncbi:Metacaspase-1 [Dichanthelium oligosanthes]|uniref:Metacaspase-1 n=1 Tax=Dichanthelium oligosanthes TaxID=888268 RepID=A0A1E5WJD0_9POAL|nr:Metacaspase-1 [Dichanthelium oligosanthes]